MLFSLTFCGTTAITHTLPSHCAWGRWAASGALLRPQLCRARPPKISQPMSDTNWRVARGGSKQGLSYKKCNGPLRTHNAVHQHLGTSSRRPFGPNPLHGPEIRLGKTALRKGFRQLLSDTGRLSPPRRGSLLQLVGVHILEHVGADRLAPAGAGKHRIVHDPPNLAVQEELV